MGVILGGLGESLAGLVGSWRRLGRILEVVGDGLSGQRTRRGKNYQKRGGAIRLKKGSENHLDAKIDPRTQEIEEKTDEAGKLKISNWTCKTRVQMDVGVKDGRNEG